MPHITSTAVTESVDTVQPTGEKTNAESELNSTHGKPIAPESKPYILTSSHSPTTASDETSGPGADSDKEGHGKHRGNSQLSPIVSQIPTITPNESKPGARTARHGNHIEAAAVAVRLLCKHEGARGRFTSTTNRARQQPLRRAAAHARGSARE